MNLRLEKIKNRIKNIYQRVRYGISDYDCMDLDVFMAEKILKYLIRYKNMPRNSVPDKMYVTGISGYKFTDKKASDDWESIIDEVIWTFQYISDPDSINPMPHNIESTLTYTENYTKFDIRKQEGLKLFAKHYSDFWN